MKWNDTIFEEDLSLAIIHFTKHCEEPNHPYDQIVRYRHKSGSTVWGRCREIAIRQVTKSSMRLCRWHLIEDLGRSCIAGMV